MISVMFGGDIFSDRKGHARRTLKEVSGAVFAKGLLTWKRIESPGMSDSTTSIATLWDILDLLSEISRIGFL
jgi:hypothetical protein